MVKSHIKNAWKMPIDHESKTMIVLISLQQKVQNRQLSARQYENVDKCNDIFESENSTFLRFLSNYLKFVILAGA